jgi:hypothetical protein
VYYLPDPALNGKAMAPLQGWKFAGYRRNGNLQQSFA